LYSSLNISKVMKPRNMQSAGYAACIWSMRNAKKVLVRQPERQKPPKKSTGKLEACIKTDLK
jgi:hypothetical protein